MEYSRLISFPEHRLSRNRRQPEKNSTISVFCRTGSGILAISANCFTKRLISLVRSVQASISSAVPSKADCPEYEPSSLEASLVEISPIPSLIASNEEITPVTVFWTSWDIIRIVFSYAFLSAFITSWVRFSTRTNGRTNPLSIKLSIEQR